MMDFTCAVVVTNRNFRIVSWNRAAESAYGWSNAEATGKNLDELLKSEYVGCSFEEAFAGLLSAGRVEFDALHTARDGRRVSVRGTSSLSRNADGDVTGIVHVFHEASEAPGGEGDGAAPAEPAGEDRSGLLSMLQGLAEDVWVYDIPSNTEWHSAGVSGAANAGIGGEPSMHADDWEDVDAAMRQAVAEGRDGFSLQYRARVADGYRWTLNRGRIEYDEQGRPCRMYGVATDVTDLKAAEQRLEGRVAELERQAARLEHKNRLMTDFFTNVSHEFKTPLSIMLVDLQLMEYRLRGPSGGDIREKLGKTVAIMRQNALRLLRLIGNLLDVTKVEAGFMKARLINADVVGLVSNLTESVRAYAESAGLELKFMGDRASRLMPLDGEKLERILLNLLSNAIKHTPKGGHISVTVTNTPESAVISVKDDGEGVPADKKDVIFDRFRQVNTSLTRMSEGCGIGLSLTRALVELLKGRIWFESAPGAGCEFFFELPVLQADIPSSSPEVDGIPRDKKVEMEFSNVNRIERG